VPTDRERQYIQKEWIRKKMLAVYARQHSAVIDTTNGVENFHSVIAKHNSGKSLRQQYVSSPLSAYILAVSQIADSIRRLVARLLGIGERIQADAKDSAQNTASQGGRLIATVEKILFACSEVVC
jgi:hypothetical protein